MSQASRAKTAKERAKIAAAFIRSGRNATRAFDDCFEMYDGAEVIAELRKMAKRGPKLRMNWSRYLSAPIDDAT